MELKCKCKSNVNEHVNLHVAFFGDIFHQKAAKSGSGQKNQTFLILLRLLH